MKAYIKILIAILVSMGSLHAQYNTAYNYHTTRLALPDLVVTSIKVPYIPPYARLYSGNTIKLPVKVTIKNRGVEEARSSWGIYTNLKVHGKLKDGERTGRIPVGQSRTFKMTAHIPVTYNGRRISITSTVDPPGGGKIPEQGAPAGGLVREQNERNNTKKVHIQIPVFKKINKKNLD